MTCLCEKCESVLSDSGLDLTVNLWEHGDVKGEINEMVEDYLRKRLKIPCLPPAKLTVHKVNMIPDEGRIEVKFNIH